MLEHPPAVRAELHAISGEWAELAGLLESLPDLAEEVATWRIEGVNEGEEELDFPPRAVYERACHIARVVLAQRAARAAVSSLFDSSGDEPTMPG